jgi:uncharacterized protein YkwD
MTRVLLLAGLCAALAGGCGGDGADRGAQPAPPAGPATVELTDGRLGDATEIRPGGAERELSPGGRPDLREPDDDDTPRRDGVGAGAACADPTLPPAADSLGGVAAATLCLLNGERADRGLAPLASNDQLGAAASAFAQDLVAGSYFSHTGRDGSDVLDRIERTGYIQAGRGWAVGENLAWGTGALATPGAIVQAWMNSPGHRENILNPTYREIGIGIALGNPEQRDGAGATYTTEFGAIDAAAPATKVRAAAKRRRGKAQKSRTARRGGKGGKHRRGAKSRGPKARIAI